MTGQAGEKSGADGLDGAGGAVECSARVEIRGVGCGYGAKACERAQVAV